MKQQLLLSVAAMTLLAGGGLSAQEAPRSAGHIYKVETLSPQIKAKRLAKAPSRANVDLFSGRTLQGAVTATDSWADVSYSATPFGFYDFNIAATSFTDFTQVYVLPTDKWRFELATGAYADGIVYALRPAYLFGSLTGIDYLAIGPATQNILWSETITDDVDFSMMAMTMCWNPVRNKLYAVTYNSDHTALYWSYFDLNTRRFKNIAAWRNKCNPLAMACDYKGDMYAISGEGDLYSIDPETGLGNMIGGTGVIPAYNMQCATWDGATGTIIWCALTGSGTATYTVDPETGKASLISRVADNPQIVLSYMPQEYAFYGAPSKMSTMLPGFYSGSLQGGFQLQFPNKTYGGASLTGTLNGALYIDGEKIMEGKYTPGQSLYQNVTVTEGLHTAAMVLSNNIGYAPVSTVSFYAGFDTPVPVENANFTYDADTRKATVTWDGVTAGVHGGYIPTWGDEAVGYNVYRNPGNVLVAENIKATSYEEEMPKEMKAYYYTVVANNGENRLSEPVNTNTLVCGDAFVPPYACEFGDQTLQSVFTIINADGDYNQWRFDTWNNSLALSTYNDCDDYIILPKIQMKKGMAYLLQFKVSSFNDTYTESLDVRMTTANTLEAVQAAAPLLTITNESFSGPTLKEVQLIPVEDGDYFIAFHGTKAGHSSQINLKDITVDPLGLTTAPQKVSTLTVTPNANGENKATVKVTLPTTTIGGDKLTGNLDLQIKRDDEVIATLTSLAPGSEKVYDDNDVASVGFHTYEVTASNASGLGASASSKVFIGLFTAPYSEDFSAADANEMYSYEIVNKPTEPMMEKSVKDGALNMTLTLNGGADEALYVYSPTIKLSAGNIYRLSFEAKITGYYNPTYAVTFGQGANPEAQNVVLDLPSDANWDFAPFTVDIPVFEDGYYNFAFRLGGEKDFAGPNMVVDNIKLEYYASTSTPGMVEELKVVPAADASLKTTITFNAPSLDYGGGELEKLDKVDIYRGQNATELIHSFEAPKPGQELSFTDSEAKSGYNDYVIVGYNEYGCGKLANGRAYAGLDIPAAVETLNISTDVANQTPTLSWTPVTTGQHDGVVPADKLGYVVVEYVTATQEFKTLGTTTETSFTVERTPVKEQDLYCYGVIALTETGQSMVTLNTVVLGDPIEVPFAESFPNGAETTKLWTTDGASDYASWEPCNIFYYDVTAQDDDNGAAVFFNGAYSAFTETVTLISPKILADNYLLTLTFYTYEGLQSSYDKKPQIEVLISCDDQPFEPLGEPIILSEAATPGWVKHTIDLSDYTAKNIRIGFKGSTDGYNDFIYLDNITIDGEKRVGINTLETNQQSGPSIWYDLQGRHIDKPSAPGVYIVVNNSKAQKILVK